MSLQIHQMWISPGHDFVGRHGLGRLDHGVIDCQELRCVAGSGIEGDRFFNHKEDFKGQITLIALEMVDALMEHFQLDSLDASLFRRNVLVSGADLNSLIGQEFSLGEVVLQGACECAPCYWMDEAICEGACAFMQGRGGLRCRIVQGGVLRIGSQSELVSH